MEARVDLAINTVHFLLHVLDAFPERDYGVLNGSAKNGRETRRLFFVSTSGKTSKALKIDGGPLATGRRQITFFKQIRLNG